MTHRQLTIAFNFFIITLFISSCGFKGDLYIPNKQVETPNVPALNTTKSTPSNQEFLTKVNFKSSYKYTLKNYVIRENTPQFKKTF